SFFFQAEDGIRDSSVTGVQTCALPIYGSRYGWRHVAAYRATKQSDASTSDVPLELSISASSSTHVRVIADGKVLTDSQIYAGDKIGRASCRERVKQLVIDGQLRKQHVK